MINAEGEFQVELKPIDSHAEGIAGNTLGRMSILKRYSGAMQGESTGEMLTALSPIKGSAGYVAVEQFVGELDGKQGSFVLQHYGLMDNGYESLVVDIVPDTGTADLTGIRGKLTILVENGDHFYQLDYEMQ